MPEKILVGGRPTIEYSGLFNFQEFYFLIKKLFKEKGYDWFEKKHREEVLSGGKYIKIDLEPWKKISDYVKLSISMSIEAKNLKEKEIVKDKEKIKVNEGDLEIGFQTWVITDYEGRLENTPGYFFFKVLVEKFIVNIYKKSWEKHVQKDFEYIRKNIKSFLNLYKY